MYNLENQVMKKLTKMTLNHNDFGRYSYSPYCGLVKNRLSLMKNSNILLDKFCYLTILFHKHALDMR